MKPALSEAAIQQHAAKLLHAYGRPDICWWHCPNGELRNVITGAKLKQAGVRAGASDFMLLIDGHFHAVEIKTEIGSLSGRQEEFGADIERAGGGFHVAFGLDQLVAVLTAIGAFRAGVTITTALGKGARSGVPASAGPRVHQSPREAGAPA